MQICDKQNVFIFIKVISKMYQYTYLCDKRNISIYQYVCFRKIVSIYLMCDKQIAGENMLKGQFGDGYSNSECMR